MENNNAQSERLIIGFAVIVCLLGAIAAIKLPNALLPDINRPEIQLFTNWSGKTPQQIEQTLIAPLERQLQGIPNLLQMQSQVSMGSAQTTLVFHSNTDMQQTYVDVLTRVNQIPGWPPQVERPFIRNDASAANRTLATAMLYSNVSSTERELIQAFKQYIRPAVQKVNGVGSLVTATTTVEERVDIEFSPESLSRHSLPLAQVVSALQGLVDQTGDALVLGDQEYALHFRGQMTFTELEDLAIAATDQHVVRLRDVADIHIRVAEDWNYASMHGQRALYFIITPTNNVNLLDTADRLKSLVSELNEGPLKPLDLTLSLSRDDSKDVRQALQLVYGSLILGIALAVSVLWLFLRDWTSIGLILISIPVCLAFVLLAMLIGGFNLNVISLAGMALSVGLVLDAAIIVVENVNRHLNEGTPLLAAAKKGAFQVKGAIISSTVSSIIIFVPVLLLKSPEGQLFKDLAFTISSALIASMCTALLLLPALARIIQTKAVKICKSVTKQHPWLLLPVRRPKLAVFIVFLAVPGALVASYLLLPSVDVLPDPKQRSVRVFVNFHQPLSAQATEEKIVQPIFQRIEQQVARGLAPDYDVYGMFCTSDNCLLYFYPEEGWHYDSFRTWLESDVLSGIPGISTFIQQGSLLRFALPDSRVTFLDLKGLPLPQLQNHGLKLLDKLKSAFPDADIRANTPLSNTNARIEFIPKQDTIVHLGLTQEALNRHLVALTDGVFLGRFFAADDTLPFYFKGQAPAHLNALLDTQIMLEENGLVALGQLVDARLSLAPSSVLRTEGQVTASIQLSPQDGLPMGEFMQQVQRQVESYLSAELGTDLYVGYRGSADKLAAFLQEFGQMFILALFILALLMWINLKSVKLALAVMCSMPLALLGGVATLQALNLFTTQNLDVVTLFGFIILIGLVINNGILLATEFKQGALLRLSQQASIERAIRLRKRPIYMSTSTSILGMLPLMLSPGEGAEIYRGLAAVIIGGMTFSAMFSLTVMAAILTLPFYETASGPNKVENPAPGLETEMSV